MSEIEGGPGPALFDPLGGVIDAELTVKVPRDHVRPCNKRIVEIARGPRKISLKSTDDETWTVDNLIVATGVDSPSLIAMTGAPIPKSIYRHVRFTL